jgi:alanyl aminopeptidase|nr:M1 family metallopeptidase [Kofleriaceae bacterium]
MQRCFAALLLVAACGASAPPPTTPPTTGSASTTGSATADDPYAAVHQMEADHADPAPALRLPTTVRPTHNTAELAIDPDKEDFTGTITTTLEIAQPTSTIWLNGDEIAIASATLAQGGATLTASVVAPKKGYLGLHFTKPVATGDATLTIRYAGKMHPNDGDGIYTLEQGGDHYAYTQFESTDARQAFPTFDEPSFKVPWQISLRVSSKLAAVSNTPIAGEHDNGDGTKTVSFAETKPLPSYLVAFAVGPFDFVDAGKTPSGVPIRIVVPKGRAPDAAYAAKVSTELLDRLEKYFGIPYPYPKLDLVAVHVFNAGAMENAGMITFNEPLLLTKPTDMTRDREESYATVAAHEMAHQWFGDLVTMEFWDNTWLNESFASWMEAKLVDAWKPEWELGVGMVGTKSGVMAQDMLDTARAIYQPIKDQGDILNAFDGITYQKGQAVLTMIERHLGADVFQKGVRDYLQKHAWGNATYDDFVGAMSTAAGKDLHPLFDSFVKQSGIPYVSMTVSCKAGAPKLELSQTRYAPVGSQMSADDKKRTWSVPVCVKWGAGGKTGKDCTVLDQPAGELALSTKTCPQWVMPNDGELAYYRTKLDSTDLDHLLAHAHELTVAERVGLLGDVGALVGAGDASNAVALGLVQDLAKDKSRHIVDSSLGIVAGIDDMVPDRLRPNYERMIGKLYKQRAHELGWAAKSGEGADTKELRPELLGVVAGIGKDKALIDEATKLTWKWFDDRSAIQPEVVGEVLHVAARFGDQKLFDKLHELAKASKDRTERARLIGAMGAFQDPKLVEQALAVVLTDEFDIRESFGLVFAGLADIRLRDSTLTWIEAHFDQLIDKLPKEYRPYMAYIAAPVCDESKKAEITAFLEPKMKSVDGGQRVLAQALEALSLCAAGRAQQTPGVVAFLQKQ